MRTPIQAHPVFRSSPTAGRGVARVLAARVAPSDFELCATGTIENGQACINIPVLGQKCFSSSLLGPFDGQSAKICAHVCTKIGIPRGACVTATVGNNQVAQHCFGSCSV
jgi:hypothetical protein